MTPRNPDDSPDETMQDKVLQAVHDSLNDERAPPPESLQQGAPALTERQDKMRDTKVELDRVELYLKGPTVFSA